MVILISIIIFLIPSTTIYFHQFTIFIMIIFISTITIYYFDLILIFIVIILIVIFILSPFWHHQHVKAILNNIKCNFIGSGFSGVKTYLKLTMVHSEII